MITPATVTLTALRNVGMAPEEFAFTEGGLPLDLTGYTARLQVRQYGFQAGDPMIALDQVSALGEGLFFIEPKAGRLVIQIAPETLDTLPPPGKAGASVRYVYDLVLTGPDGIAEVWMEGDFIIQPGKTRLS